MNHTVKENKGRVMNINLDHITDKIDYGIDLCFITSIYNRCFLWLEKNGAWSKCFEIFHHCFRLLLFLILNGILAHARTSATKPPHQTPDSFLCCEKTAGFILSRKRLCNHVVCYYPRQCQSLNTLIGNILY